MNASEKIHVIVFLALYLTILAFQALYGNRWRSVPQRSASTVAWILLPFVSLPLEVVLGAQLGATFGHFAGFALALSAYAAAKNSWTYVCRYDGTVLRVMSSGAMVRARGGPLVFVPCRDRDRSRLAANRDRPVQIEIRHSWIFGHVIGAELVQFGN